MSDNRTKPEFDLPAVEQWKLDKGKKRKTYELPGGRTARAGWVRCLGCRQWFFSDNLSLNRMCCRGSAIDAVHSSGFPGTDQFYHPTPVAPVRHIVKGPRRTLEEKIAAQGRWRDTMHHMKPCEGIPLTHLGIEYASRKAFRKAHNCTDREAQKAIAEGRAPRPKGYRRRVIVHNGVEYPTLKAAAAAAGVQRATMRKRLAKDSEQRVADSEV